MQCPAMAQPLQKKLPVLRYQKQLQRWTLQIKSTVMRWVPTFWQLDLKMARSLSFLLNARIQVVGCRPPPPISSKLHWPFVSCEPNIWHRLSHFGPVSKLRWRPGRLSQPRTLQLGSAGEDHSVRTFAVEVK